MSKGKHKSLVHRGPNWKQLRKAKQRASTALNKIKHIEAAIIKASGDHLEFLKERLEHWKRQ